MIWWCLVVDEQNLKWGVGWTERGGERCLQKNTSSFDTSEQFEGVNRGLVTHAKKKT